MALARITVTLPRDLVAAADRRAQQLDRSRSWVVAEALRVAADRAVDPGLRAQVKEPPTVHYRAGLGDYRFAQLQADLALSPEQRVREAERTARVSGAIGHARGRPAQRVLFFDRYEDYLDWKRVPEVAP
jgi:ribbon-helix-helix CopG family protein